MPFVNELIDHNREQAARTMAGTSRLLFDPAEVMSLLRSRIVGQDAALGAVESMLQVIKAGIGDPERPLAVNLFLGPTGVGKTEIVRLLAQAIHGRPDAFCRIDMNTLAQEHYAAALTGAPPGYVGSKEGTTLFDVEAIAGSFSRPGIVLFDELEKASREVVRSLLNVLDSGQLTLAAGTRRIDFRNSLIFMTSNIGAQEAAEYRSRFQRGWRRALRVRPRGEGERVERALHRHFEPEFLNRIDRILTFARIDGQWLEALLDIELGKLEQRLRKTGRELIVTGPARDWLCSGHDARFGARDLARRLRTRLEPALAEAMLGNPDCQRFKAEVGAGQLQVRVLR
ncbi:AAA family ATPase [Pseudomonas lopnurensis]|uniref:AAA family ATPase n=2 Tax=Pseudomonas lopnurensis TaxID=1477517 RepID=UPI0018796C90|nr:AAA family ATPase [Pseudomonas lopnurensis]MBE7373616.1 ATP-dependent Clp protease ATP-binding subunit [Pseudomonas lopnurensis]